MGKVIRGWDEGQLFVSELFPVMSLIFCSIGVPKLSLGEKAMLTVTPDYVRTFDS